MEEASRISSAPSQQAADGPAEGERDHLTGALSRASFEQHLLRLVSRSREYGEPFSLMAIDLDHFKSVNDAFGHPRGDRLLRHVAERARGAIREGDLFFRYGGDEFMVLLPDSDRREAVRVAERLLARVQDTPFSGEPPLTLTLSIGVASFPDDAASAQELLKRADARAYSSKRRGRGRITSTDLKAGDALVFDPGARPLERDAQLETVQAFFAELPRLRRGALRIGGPRGAGHTRMLREVTQLAALQGYGVLALQGALPLQPRLYGALANATFAGKPLPPTALVNLEGHLADRLLVGSAGLLIAIDDLAYVDRATLTALAELLEAEAFCVAIAYSVAANDQVRFQKAPLQKRCELAPLSAAAVPLWLRHVLQWEAPADFVDWFYLQTGGLPAHLQQGLMILLERELLSQSGTGWRLAPAIAELDLASLLTDRRSYPAHALPNWKGPFVGRSEELARLAELFDEERLITLTGPGGSGKSRLAAQFGLEQLARKRESVFFVSLTGLGDSELIAGTILAAMEIPAAGSARLSEQLLNALSQRPALLILDNFEHLLGGAALVADMLNKTPAQLLVTSREPLRLPDEVPYLLRGLDLPPDAETPSFDSYGAVQLFVTRARQADAAFELHERDRPHLLRICQLSEGVPLALELAAAWIKVLSCATIASELEKSLGFLQETPGERGRLGGILDYFWRLLAPPEQRTVSYLATFRGGFSAEAAKAVAGASPFLLLGLVDRALLSTDESGRYQLHELLRQYAWQQLDEPTEIQAAEERHARYFADLAEWCERQPIKRKNDLAYATIDAELDNFRAAWRWAVRHRRAELLEPMTRALRGYFDIRGQLREARALFEQAAAALDGLPEAASARGWALEAQALFSYHLDRYDASQRLAEEALALLVPRGPSEALAMTLNTLGMLASGREDYVSARDYFERSKAVQEALGDKVGAARALSNLATTNDLAGNKRQAKRDYLACIELHRRHQNDTSLALALINLAHVCNDLGELDEAERALREGLAISEQVGYRLASISALCGLADTAHLRGDLGEAEAHLIAAIRSAEQAGNLRFRRNAYRKLAELALEQGELAQAGAHLGHTFELIKRQSAAKEPIDECLLLAEWLIAQDAPLKAAEILGYLQRFAALEANPKGAELKGALAATLSEAAFAAALKRGQGRDAASLLGEAETLLSAQHVSEQPA
jgi:diguanylate cyclase (GGDEF)-like protein